MEYRVWEPKGEVKAVVQILHGMAEHIDRYGRMALALNARGYAVAGHNHRGHGANAEKLGFFAKERGWDAVIEDAHEVTLALKKRYPGKKLVLLGHSMGSFAAREYALRYGRELDGLVLSGTGYYPAALAMAGKMAALLSPKDKPAKLVDKLAFSGNNKPFRPARTPCDWLSRDEKEVDRYIADPLCGFLFTGQAYRDFFGGLMKLADEKRLAAMPKGLPVYFMSGEKDPVGQMGAGVKTVAEQFRRAGMMNIAVRLYPDARHELFNELNRDQATEELADWLDGCIGEETAL